MFVRTNKDDVDVDIDRMRYMSIGLCECVCVCASMRCSDPSDSLAPRPQNALFKYKIKYKIIFSFQNKTKINDRFEPRR